MFNFDKLIVPLLSLLEKSIGPITIIIILFIYRKYIGSLILKLSEIDFKKTKNGYFLSAKTGKETFPIQVKNEISKDKLSKFEELLNTKKYEILETEIDQWKRNEKNSIYPYILLGRSYILQGKEKLAEHEFKKVLKREYNNSEINYYLGALLLKKDDLDNAKEYLIKAYNLDNNDPRTTLALAYISFYLEKDINASIEYINVSHDSYKKRREQFPLYENIDISIHQSMEYYLANRGNEEDFRRAFEIDNYIEKSLKDYTYHGKLTIENQAFTLDTRGYLRLRAVEENFRSAKKTELIKSSINYFTKALELIPTDVDIVNNMIKSYKYFNNIIT
ncbi:MAG: hypothetical protein KAI43_10260 [Candidatus Aureabacteria bacterium]|nr:hypothetical protein [Candidatus Auribacterota bacterium]